MNKKINSKKTTMLVMLLIIISATILSGCTGTKTVETPGGKVTVNEGAVGPDWCKAGMKITDKVPQGEGTFEIKGITTYDGRSVCEATIKMSGTTGEQDVGVWKYYFTEKKDYVVMVTKDSSGKEQKLVLNDQSPK